ncbi:reverse transcriptase family protein [Kocuria sp. CPCC 104605]|uniref:RNA-directed DNA polymerase n=1 Tax=Kocuria subflava TaxID=1736139 RepID=A0A846UAJ0_9MICC|nr:RNA-directed DNA polymerase [Kocuria subflava]
MNHSSPHHYSRAGREAGVSESVVRAALAQSHLIEESGSFPILSLGHLAHLSGAPYLYLREIVQRVRDPYQDISQRKKSGGTRPISAPEPVLMDVHRFILDRALASVPLHPASFAYTRGRNIKQCAERHLGAKWLFKFDITNFFGQVKEPSVFRVFRRQGYSRLVSLELTRICTRAPLSKNLGSRSRYDVIPSYSVDQRGWLPQGAPTSGALSNAVAAPLDHDLTSLADRHGLVYSRYSDDMFFSAGQGFSRPKAKALVREVDRTVQRHRFLLHRKKTRVIPPGARHIVLGLLVDSGQVRLLPEFRRRVEVHIRGVGRFGLDSHVEHRGFRSMFSFISHVDGCLAFASSVEPDWAESCRVRWEAVLKDQGFPI